MVKAKILFELIKEPYSRPVSWDTREVTFRAGESFQIGPYEISVPSISSEGAVIKSDKFEINNHEKEKLASPYVFKKGETIFLNAYDKLVVSMKLAELEGKQSASEKQLQENIVKILSIFKKYQILGTEVEPDELGKNIAQTMEKKGKDLLSANKAVWFWNSYEDNVKDSRICIVKDWWFDPDIFIPIIEKNCGVKLEIKYPKESSNAITIVIDEKKVTYQINSDKEIDFSKRVSNYIWLKLLNKIMQDHGINSSFAILYEEMEDFGVSAVIDADKKEEFIKELKPLLWMSEPKFKVKIEKN